MSLHAQLSPEALERLNRQRRNSTISSVVVSLLSIVFVGLVLGLILLPGLEKNTEVIVSYIAPGVDDTTVEPKKISTQRPSPSAPSSASARVITANTVAPVALEVPEISYDFEGFGPASDDFGDGWSGDGDGSGAGGGGGGFGSTGARPGSLEGRLYDFKQTPDGKDIPYNLADRAEFVDRIARLHRSNFSAPALRRHFQAPNSLFLTHLAIPLTDAGSGPKFFGAEKTIKPSGWMAHYRGKITAPKTGTYRFSGLGDDYIAVLINGRPRLIGCWSDIQEGIAGRWEPTEPTGRFKSPFSGMRLVYGDWIKMKEGEVLDIDIAVGERPGGKVGFILHIEEKDAEYRTAPDGRPILPLFATAPISGTEKIRIMEEFGSYEIEWQNVPVFGVK